MTSRAPKAADAPGLDQVQDWFGDCDSDRRGERTAELVARLRTLQDERAADEREGAKLPTVLRAIAVTRGNRDAGSSRTLRAHRAQLERIWADAEDLLVLAARTAVRVHLRGADAHDPVVRRARQAIDDSMRALDLLSHHLQEEP